MTDHEPYRVGVVSSVNRKKCTAKVCFEELDDSVSFDLKVIVQNTMSCKHYWMPHVGEAVVCLFLENGIETGFIIGSFYSDVDKPPPEISENDKDRDGIWFEDGTFIKYEVDTNTLVIDVKNKILVKAPEIEIKGTIKKDMILGLSEQSASFN